MKFAAYAAMAVCVVLLLSGAGTGCSTTASHASNLPAGVWWNGKGPMSEYDKELIRTIQAKWFSLLEEVKESLGVGIVKVSFQLHADGTIDSPTITDSTIQPWGVDLAVRAVSEAAPFEPWPEKLVRRTGGASREIGITFYYQ
ncbi:MAG: hypothetical protein ACKVYV_03725 [Limisphaerales bacterium]